MVSTSSLTATLFLVVSLIGNVEQYKELDMRSTQVSELKLEKEALTTGAALTQEELTKLRKERVEAKEQQAQLAKELSDLRNQKNGAEREIQVLREGLRGKELSEEHRILLEKDLAKATGKMEVQEELIRKKEKDVTETQEHLSQLSLNVCGAFTPRGLVQMVNDWVNVSPWTICILGNVVFSALAAFGYRLLMYPRKALADKDTEDQHRVAKPVPVYNWWVFYLPRTVVTWGVAIYALTILPVLLTNFAGSQAMNVMEGTRSSFCGGAGFCNWGFDNILTPNAIMAAQGEVYLQAARGWQRVVLSQTLALLADRTMVVMICVLAWPFGGRGLPALSDTTANGEDQIKPIGDEHS